MGLPILLLLCRKCLFYRKGTPEQIFKKRIFSTELKKFVINFLPILLPVLNFCHTGFVDYTMYVELAN